MAELSYEDAMLKVKAGAVFLDEKLGEDWVHGIDLETLRLESGCNCIIGQLKGGFRSGCLALGIEPYDDHKASQVTLDLGFNVPGDTFGNTTRNYYTLTQAWRDYITERRGY